MKHSKKRGLLLSVIWATTVLVNLCIKAESMHIHQEPSLVHFPQQNNEHEVWVTVFVHGIMSIQPHLTLHNIMRFIRDDVKDTIYSKTVEYMRANPYFYLNQAMQETGLKEVDMFDLQPGNASSAIANIYDQVTKTIAPNTDNHYYTFGWSGLLSPTGRYEDSVKLFQELTAELREKYWNHNIIPKIRLIGYSHGGNVCLNIAAAKNNTDPNSLLSVDELILVGVPIQTETDYLSADPIFKKIYHIFSRADRIQRIDFFSFNRIFSRRYFRSNHHFKVPKKLMQIEIKINRKARTRYETLKRNAEYLNFKASSIISGRSRLFKNVSPGHLEFWFFGWSPKHYRNSFILRPLPAFVIIPYIVHCINSIKPALKNPYPVVVDIRPELETMVIKQRKKNNQTKVFSFLSREQLDQLSKTAHQVAIDSSFEDEYEKHVQDAFKKAKHYYKTYDHHKARSGSFKRNRRMRKRNLTNVHVEHKKA
jgi:pimeloyl-ACP methyl ester carboxylesterase